MPSRVTLNGSHLPFRPKATVIAKARAYRIGLTERIFAAKSQITTAQDILPLPEDFNPEQAFVVVLLKPTSSLLGNFTRNNILSLLNRFDRYNWAARAVRIIRGESLHPSLIKRNYAQVFDGMGAFEGEKAGAVFDKEERLRLQEIYGRKALTHPVFHAAELVDPKFGLGSKGEPACFSIEEISALWEKGYYDENGDRINEVHNAAGINLIGEKKRVLIIDRPSGWPKTFPKRFFLYNGYGIELVRKMTRPGELLLIMVFQSSDDRFQHGEIRNDCIGATNPGRAKAGSVRKDALGVAQGDVSLAADRIIVPDVVEMRNNMVHCSDSAGEARKELEVWIKPSLVDLLLSPHGYSQAQREQIETQPRLSINGSETNLTEVLLHQGVASLKGIFPPFHDGASERTSAPLSFERWRVIAGQYEARILEVGTNRIAARELIAPLLDGIASGAGQSYRLPRNPQCLSREIWSAGGINSRFYSATVSEGERAKGFEPLFPFKRGKLSALEVRLLMRTSSPLPSPHSPILVVNDTHLARVEAKMEEIRERWEKSGVLLPALLVGGGLPRVNPFPEDLSHPSSGLEEWLREKPKRFPYARRVFRGKAGIRTEDYLYRMAEIILNRQGPSGTVCCDTTGSVSRKALGQLDALTVYTIKQLKKDWDRGIRAAFISSEMDFAFEVDPQLLSFVLGQDAAFTFLVNPVRNFERGGGVFRRRDSDRPLLVHRWQIDGKTEDLRASDGRYYKSIFRLGVNLAGWLSFLGFDSPPGDPEAMREKLWERIYSRILPNVTLKRIDRNRIFAAEFDYFIDQVTQLEDLRTVFLTRGKGQNFPYFSGIKEAGEIETSGGLGYYRKRVQSRIS